MSQMILLLSQDEIEMILNWFNYALYHSKTTEEEVELADKLNKMEKRLENETKSKT